MVEIHKIRSAEDGTERASVFLRGNVYCARYTILNTKVSGRNRYVTETLKTKDLHVAIARAHVRLAEIIRNEKLGASVSNVKVEAEIDAFMKEYRTGVEQGLINYSRHMLRGYERSVVRYWREYVGKKRLQDIGYADMEAYEGWRQSYWERKEAQGEKLHGNSKRRAARRTVEWEIGAFKQFLGWARRKGRYAGDACEFVFAKGVHNRRSAFTRADYNKLTSFMRRKEWLEVGKHGNDPRLIRYRVMLRAYVLFLANTGLRVGEARNLKWSDVVFATNASGEEIVRVFVHGTHSKVKKRREVIGLSGAAMGLKRLLESRKAADDHVGKEDYIWCNEVGEVIADFREGFNTLIRAAGVEFDSNGVKMTLYSLRHTYITYRLQEGVGVYDIATNCGTSVAMIEKYYSDAKSADFVNSLTVRKASHASK
ncbi:MAG: tyrosine-type recombinase/integrase [Bacteroidales bacterium]